MTNEDRERGSSPYVPEGASPRPWDPERFSLTFHEFVHVWTSRDATEDEKRLVHLAVSNYEEACRLLEAMRGCAVEVMPDRESELTEKMRDLLDECDRSFWFLQSAREQAAQGGERDE